MSEIEHIAGTTFHGRKGSVENAFSYGVDYVMFDPEAEVSGPGLFSRNAGNLVSFWDRDHGGAPKAGSGVQWFKQIVSTYEMQDHVSEIRLLAQPRVLGHVFNPVSFWLGFDADNALRIVVPEVSNTYGDRHSYLCVHDDKRAIAATDTLNATKVFHVSPFQPVEGDYRFRFDIRPEKIGIWIDYSAGEVGENGLLATLTGKRGALTNRSILRASLRRPFGSRRVLGLIHWQALKLWWKGAMFRSRPEPPTEEISR